MMASVLTSEINPSLSDSSVNAELFYSHEQELPVDRLERLSQLLVGSHIRPLVFAGEFITQYRAYQNKLYENPEFTQELRSVYPIEVSDGTTYSTRLLNRRFLNEARPLFVTPPLGVGDFGYWEMRLYSLATTLQMPIFSVSGEGHSYGLKRPNLLRLSFPQIGRNMHEVLDNFPSTSGINIDFSSINAYGESRGAMIALEMAAQQSSSHNMETIIAAGACGHEKPTLENLLKTVNQFVIREPLALARHLRKDIDPKQRAYILARLARTALIGPQAVPSIVKTGLNILQAPLRDIKSRLPSAGTDIHMLFFEADSTSNAQAWIEDFHDHPHFHFGVFPGGHTDGILGSQPVIEAARILYSKYGRNRRTYNARITALKPRPETAQFS